MTTPPAPTDPPADPQTDPPAADPADTETFTAADRAALQRALAAERKLHRDAAAKLTQLENAQASDSDRAWQDKVAKVQADGDARYKALAVRAALQVSGLQGKPEGLVRLLDMDAVTVGDDGTVTGLDDQLAALKRDYPGLFAQPNGKPPVPGRADAGARNPVPTTKKNFAQTLADQLAGKA